MPDRSPDLQNYILAQALHETGGLKSDIFQENNNPFGMKLARKRATFAIGENRGHATFDSIESAVADFDLWARYMNMPKDFPSEVDYVQWLKSKSYFEDSVENYLKGVQFWLKNLN